MFWNRDEFGCSLRDFPSQGVSKFKCFLPFDQSVLMFEIDDDEIDDDNYSHSFHIFNKLIWEISDNSFRVVFQTTKDLIYLINHHNITTQEKWYLKRTLAFFYFPEFIYPLQPYHVHMALLYFNAIPDWLKHNDEQNVRNFIDNFNIMFFYYGKGGAHIQFLNYEGKPHTNINQITELLEERRNVQGGEAPPNFY